MISIPNEDESKLDSRQIKIDVLKRRIHRLTVDPVTNLPKKEGFIDMVREETDDVLDLIQNPFATLVIDIDHLKLFNDTYGHHAGDKYLLKVAGEMDQQIWDVNDQIGLVFRAGGDEFFALLEIKDGSEESYRKRIEDITENINTFLAKYNQLLNKKDVKIRPGLSIGSFFVDKGIQSKDSRVILDKVFSYFEDPTDKAVYAEKERKPQRIKRNRFAGVTFFEDIKDKNNEK